MSSSTVQLKNGKSCPILRYTPKKKITAIVRKWAFQNAFRVCRSCISPVFLHALKKDHPMDDLWVIAEGTNQDQVIAFCVLEQLPIPKQSDAFYVYLHVLCSKPAGLGYGTFLLGEIIRCYAKETKFRFMELRAFPHLITFYQKFGFQIGSALTKRRRRHFPGEHPRDGLRMHFNLQYSIPSTPRRKSQSKSLYYSKTKPVNPFFKDPITFCQSYEQWYFS